MRRAIFFAVLGGAVAIAHEALLAGPIVDTVSHGGPAWLLWFLALPVLDLFAGLALASWSESRSYNARQRPPASRGYRFVDEPLPDDISPTEAGMLRRNDSAFTQHAQDAMGLFVTPWPVNLGIVKPRGGEQ